MQRNVQRVQQTNKRLMRAPGGEAMWAVGMTTEETDALTQAVGPGFSVLALDPERDLPEQAATTAWIPWRAWRLMDETGRERFRCLEATQRILLQEEHDEDVEIEEVLEHGFLTVIRLPLTRSKVRDALFRAREVATLYADIYRMTREIFLERELLARKTDQLTFLNRVLESASRSLDPGSILDSARRDLCLLLPVHHIMAAFFALPDTPTDLDRGQIRFFLPRLTPQSQETWNAFLLDQAVRLGFGPVEGFRTEPIGAPDEPSALTPADGRTVVLPLKSGETVYGCLALLCDMNTRLAKDQVQTLRAAVNHLSLALHNALVHSAVKTQADHDALTRLNNRRCFDERLSQELVRARRYGHSLSLLMIDLDHFKNVNDTYGHSAGDLVLAEMGGLLRGAMRASDFAARFGGEEFAVLLPHTDGADAHRLAERIRSAVAEKTFRHKGRVFSVTASIGVSSLSDEHMACGDDLLLKADQALYAAKGNGRNVVVAQTALPGAGAAAQ